MLTRTQVARRLGRSLATVRRLEGTVLHPNQDSRGVNRFDVDEVDAVAQRLMERGTGAAVHNCESETNWSGWEDPQSRERLNSLIEDLRAQLAVAERDARISARELQTFKSGVVQFLGALALQLVDVDHDLGEVVIEALRELDA